MDSIKDRMVSAFRRLFNLPDGTTKPQSTGAEGLSDEGIPVRDLGYHDRDEYEEDVYSDPDEEEEYEDGEEDDDDSEDDEEDDDDDDDDDERYEEGSQSEEWYNYYEDR